MKFDKAMRIFLTIVTHSHKNTGMAPGGGALGRSGDEKLFISHLSHLRGAKKFFFPILCNEIYTWTLGGNIFFTIFEEEFVHFMNLPSPPAPPGYLMVTP